MPTIWAGLAFESADSRLKERVDDASKIAVALRERFRLHHKLRRFFRLLLLTKTWSL